MSSESPAAVLFDFNGNELAVQNATAIPASTPALIFAGSDGTNSRYITVDTSGRMVMVGAAAAGGAPSGNPVYVAGKNSAGNLTAVISDFLGSPVSSIGANMAAVQSNATVTTSGSTIISTNDFGTQQISLVINVTASPTGTTPTITYTIQEVDPGNITTVFGNSTTSSAINSISVNTITLTSTTSNTIKVSWTVTGTTPSFTGVYTTLVTKATPTTQPISGTVSVSGTVGVTQSTSPWVDNISQFGGSNVVTGTGASGAGIPRVTVSNDSNILATQSGSWTVTATQATPANLRTQTASEATTATSTGTVAALVGGAVTTASPTYTTGQMDPLSLTTAGALRVDGSAVTQPVSGTVTANQGTANTLANAWSTKITDATNGPVAVKAASTAAVAADPSLVIAFSPNSPLPTGANVIGAVTQSAGPWTENLTQINGSAVVTAATGVQKVGIVGGTGTSLETTAGVLDYNLKNVANAAVVTAAAGVQKVGIVGNAGATVDGTLAAGTAPTDGLGTLIQYNTTQPAPTNTQTVSLQSDQAGNLLTFPGVQTKTGAVWNSGTAGNTVQYPTGTTTVGAPLGAQSFLVQLDQTTPISGGAVTFEGTYDGTNFITLPTTQVLNPQTFAQLTNPYTFVASTNQPFLLLVQGFQQVRARLSTVITGAGTVSPFWTAFIGSPLASVNSIQGMAATGTAPIGNPVYVGGKNTAGNVAPFITDAVNSIIASAGANEATVQSNATVTTSGSSIITTNDFGAQQINLIVNVSGSVTGTTPTLTYTIQEVDPGNQTTTMGNSSSTTAISAAGVFTASLNTTTSNVVKVSWTITGTTPSFGGVYSTVVSKVTPVTQTTSTAGTSSTPGIALGNITTTAKTNVAVQASTYNEQSANFTGSVRSSSAADTAAGTGARTITIYYVDVTGATAGTETATLNGTTAVNLVTTTKCFIEKIVVNTVGSGGSNAGAITLFSAAAAGGTAVAVINAGDNETYLGHHYVVTGKTCHVTDFTGTTNSSNETLFTIQTIPIPVANQVSLQISDWVTGSQTNQTQRTFSSTVNIAGPSRVQLFGAPGSTSSMTSYGSFTFFDQ